MEQQLWDVARPAGVSRVAGVRMAGFRERGPEWLDLRIVPHPAVMLVIEFGDGPVVIDGVAGARAEGSLVAGLAPEPVRARLRQVEAVQVRLSPVAAYAVLGTAPSDLDRTLVSLPDLWGRDAVRLREQLAEAPSWAARFDVIDRALAERADAGPAVDPEVAYAWERIVAQAGQVRIDDLAAASGWSRKRLWSRFCTQIGLTPKRAAMLVRFDRAAQRLATGHTPAQVAADCGYTDQSHLHRDVVSFAAATPTALAASPWLSVDEVAWSP